MWTHRVTDGFPLSARSGSLVDRAAQESLSATYYWQTSVFIIIGVPHLISLSTVLRRFDRFLV